MQTQTGTIVCVFFDRGYGFIRLETGEDVYFNQAACVSPADMRALREGIGVAFTVVTDPDGRKRAIGVVTK